VSGLLTVTPADDERRRALRRMRGVATSLFLIAAVVYVATIDRDGGWAYVHAAAEASMVGAIADWFAVTALFRHPLGLPIPHTALIPTRKDMLARSLQDFVTENFLSEAVIRTRVADAQVARRIGGWLSEPDHGRRVVTEASSLLRAGLARVNDEDVDYLVRTELLPRLAAEPLAPLAGQLLGDVVEEGAHRGIVDLVLSEADRWLAENELAFSAAIRTRAPWWSPTWLDERVARRLHQEVLAWVRDISADQNHHARRALDDLLEQLAHDLQFDDETRESAERLKARLLVQPQVAETALSLWRALSRTLQTTLADPHSALTARALDRLTGFGVHLREDHALQTRLDGHAADLAAFVVTRYGDELATVITDTIERWDGKEAASRIELYVGRDLQFIRINGTIVGGLAGLLIYSASQLV
jgi:uncharacterized membrane-anchored protein YjiN (DUF445 family)